jgi:AAA ATPase domain
MKIQVKNLGPLKEAEFEVADLTIICGGNNTGKTYATYALFGFLNTWREMVPIDIDPEVINKLMNNGTASINLIEYFEQQQTIIDEICRKYSDKLPTIFAASHEYFSKASFKAIVDLEGIDDLKTLSIEEGIMISNYHSLSIIKKMNDLTLDVVLYSHDKSPNEPEVDPSYFISDSIKNILFSKIIQSAFISSVERTGISIFRKEIDVSRNILLENMSAASTPVQKLYLFNNGYENYPLPIQFGIKFNREMGWRFLRHSSDKYKDILDDFADMINGEYKLNNDKIYYSPINNPDVQLSMYESSSSVRSLLDLGFYLRHHMDRKSLLIIDEPELNLHPENQRKIARLLARLVNIGIKVFITTHSDYIIKELNTLIMLNHDKPHLKKIAEEEGYKPEELIAAERIKAYIAENSTLVPANIDPEMGIEARSFDTTIEDMNRIQEAIVWGEE